MPSAYAKIEGWFDFEDIYDQAVAEAPADRESQFVEVGVWQGRSLVYLAEKVRESGKRIRVQGIDPCKAFEGQEAVCRTHLAPFADFVTLRVESSLDAAAKIEGPLDLAFIDGDHAEVSALADMVVWWPKIRRGGVMAGHDYTDAEHSPGVKLAVDRWARINHLSLTLRGTSWWIRKE